MSATLEDKKWKEFLRKVGKDIQNKKLLAKTSSPFVYSDIMDHFNNEMGPSGPWQEWSKSYQAQLEGKIFFYSKGGKTFVGRPGKASKHANGKKLQDNGTLRQSFKPSDYRIGAANITWFNNAKTKSGFPYAYAHDNDETPRKKLPRRSFMWLSNKAMNLIAKAYLSVIGGKK